MQAIAASATPQCVRVNSKTAALTAIATVAHHLARRVTLRDSVQWRSGGPNQRWVHNHRYRLGELRAAAHAAMSMKTVVGSPGTTMPIRPSKRHTAAKANSNQRTGQGSALAEGASVEEASELGAMTTLWARL